MKHKVKIHIDMDEVISDGRIVVEWEGEDGRRAFIGGDIANSDEGGGDASLQGVSLFVDKNEEDPALRQVLIGAFLAFASAGEPDF